MATMMFDEGNEIKYEPGGITITREMRVTPYKDHVLVAAKLFGGVQLVGRRLIRFPPARHPLLPWCFCQGIEVKGVGSFINSAIPGSGAIPVVALAGVGDYPDGGAHLTITYKTPDVSQQNVDQAQGPSQSTQSEIELASEQFDFSSQQLSLPGTFYVWSGGTELVGTRDQPNLSLVKTLPRIDYTLTRHYCLIMPTTAIRQMLGKINKSNFIVNGQIYPPDTLRFDGAQVSRKVNFVGLRFYEITYKFAVNAVFDNILGSFGAVTNAPPSGTPTSITATAHGRTTGDILALTEIGGNVKANGVWTITVIDANTFSIPVSTTDAYTSGGRWALVKDHLGVRNTGFVGWNRLFRYTSSLWEKPNLSADSTQFIHLYDEDDPNTWQTINGVVVKGLQLLFNPGAN
jgi:hypothetical protein